MIDLIRLQQQRQQYRDLDRQHRSASPTAQYQGIDETTGQRLIGLADGGLIPSNYLSTNEPQNIPLFSPNSLGLPGFTQNI
jgi:hypothetical protein